VAGVELAFGVLVSGVRHERLLWRLVLVRAKG